MGAAVARRGGPQEPLLTRGDSVSIPSDAVSSRWSEAVSSRSRWSEWSQGSRPQISSIVEHTDSGEEAGRFLRKYAHDSVKNRFEDVQEAALHHLGVKHIDEWSMPRLIRGLKLQGLIHYLKLHNLFWGKKEDPAKDRADRAIECHNWHNFVRGVRIERRPHLPQELQTETCRAVYFKVKIVGGCNDKTEPFPRGLKGFALADVVEYKLASFTPVQPDSLGSWTGWTLRLDMGTTLRGRLSCTVPMPHASDDSNEACYFAWSDPVKLDEEKLTRVPPELQQFFKYGGFMDFTSEFQRVKVGLRLARKLQRVRVATPVMSEQANVVTTPGTDFLVAESPIWLKLEDVRKQWNNLQDVPSEELRNAGAKFFCYVAPGDMLGEETSPLGFPEGGFLFIGDFPSINDENGGRQSQHDENWWQGHLKLLKLSIKRNRSLEDKLLKQLEDVSLSDGRKGPDAQKLLVGLQNARYVLRIHDKGLMPQNFYFGVFWLRFPFMFLMSTLLTTSAFLGALMQIMFCVYGDMYHTLNTSWSSTMGNFATFGLLPMFMVCSAILVHKLGDLISASFSPPYFVDFRARLLTICYGLGWHDKFAPSERSCWAVDLYFLVGLEVLPILGAVYNALLVNIDGAIDYLPHFFYLGHLGKGDTIYGGYLTGMIYNCAFMVIIYIIADIGFCALERESIPERSLRFVLEKVTDVIETHRIHPMAMRYNYLAFTLMLDATDLEDQSNEDEHQSVADNRAYCFNRYHLKRYHASPGYETNILWVPWVAMVLILWSQAGSGIQILQSADSPWLAELPWLVTAVSLIMAILCICGWLHNRFPPLVGSTFRASLALFCLIQALLFSGGFQYRTLRPSADSATRLKPIMVVNGSCNGALNCSWPDSGEAQPYPVCTQSWGSSDSSVSALDLAALSWIVYEQNESDIKQLLTKSFGPGPRLEKFTSYSKTPRWLAVRFPPGWKQHAMNASGAVGREGADTLVVAVKGTSTFKDGYLDTDLFTTIKVLQYFEFIAPVLKVMPTDFVQWMLKTVKLWAGAGGTKAMMIWNRLEKHMMELQKAERSRNAKTKFVLTGHSLGGTIAEIVAAKQGISALVWSAPGTLYSQAYFSGHDTGSVSEERMQRDTVVVMPDNDAVPRVDSQQSVVQRIQCFRKHHMPVSYFAGTTECHKIQKSACEVWRVCGDPMQRDFSETCQEFVAQDERGTLYPFLKHPILHPKVEQ